MRHAPTLLAPIKAQRLFPPHIPLDGLLPLNLDFVHFVVRPCSAVAPADGAETFESGGAGRGERELDGGAVAGCVPGGEGLGGGVLLVGGGARVGGLPLEVGWVLGGGSLMG